MQTIALLASIGVPQIAESCSRSLEAQYRLRWVLGHQTEFVDQQVNEGVHRSDRQTLQAGNIRSEMLLAAE